MEKLPFAPYDFFGYLASGFLFTAACQATFGFPKVLGQQINAVDGLFLLLAVYIMGHVLATPAKAVLEDLLVDKVLKRPSVNLFRDRKPTLRGLLFPGYYKPLPPDARSRITERLKAEGVHGFGEDLFQHVRFSHEIKSDEKILARLDSFRNQYGLNRNLSFTLLLVGAMMLTRNYYSPSPEMVSYGLAALAVSLLLLYRYLKFFRQYSYEMFNHYRPRQPQGRLV